MKYRKKSQKKSHRDCERYRGKTKQPRENTSICALPRPTSLVYMNHQKPIVKDIKSCIYNACKTLRDIRRLIEVDPQFFYYSVPQNLREKSGEHQSQQGRFSRF